MDDAQITSAINGFPRWHYEFDICGHKTPIFDAGHVNRHRQREGYFFRPLVELCGGSLVGKRVLDLGCNAGFWSLRAVEAGCEHVLGIDGRQMHVEQAELVFSGKGIPRDRWEFRCADVFDYLAAATERFDIVLCLGLFYHVSKQVTLLERIAAVNDDLLVLDTALSRRQGAVLELFRESLDEPRNACDYELVMHPSRAAVWAMVRQFGYRCVVLRPDFSDYEGAGDFRCGSRRAFVCAKRTSLEGLPGEGDPQQPSALGQETGNVQR